MTDILHLIGPHKELLSSAVLADVLDALGHRHSALPAALRPLRPDWRIFGRAATLSAMTVSAEPRQPYAVELECVDALRPGEVLVATAVERSRTRRTAAYAVDVVSEADGALRAGFQAMVFRTGRWHLGEEAWPEDWRASH